MGGLFKQIPISSRRNVAQGYLMDKIQEKMPRANDSMAGQVFES